MRTLPLLALLFIVAACQQKPLELPLGTVSDAIYNAKTCTEILADRDRLEYLYEEEKKYRPSDSYSVFSIPRDFALSIGKVFNKNIGENRKRKIRRYEKIKGEYESVKRVAIRRCENISPDSEAETSEEYTSETEVIEAEASETEASEVENSEAEVIEEENSEVENSEAEVIEEENSEVENSEAEVIEEENSEVETSEAEVIEEENSEEDTSEIEDSEEENNE